MTEPDQLWNAAQTWSDASFNATQAQAIASKGQSSSSHNDRMLIATIWIGQPDLARTPIPVTTTTSSSKKSNTGAIVGGVISGVALIFLVVVFFTCSVVKRQKWLQHSKTYSNSSGQPNFPHLGLMSNSSQMHLEPKGSGTPPGLRMSPVMQSTTISHPVQNGPQILSPISPIVVSPGVYTSVPSPTEVWHDLCIAQCYCDHSLPVASSFWDHLMWPVLHKVGSTAIGIE